MYKGKIGKAVDATIIMAGILQDILIEYPVL